MIKNVKLFEESLRFLKDLKPGDQIGKDTYVPGDGLNVNSIMIVEPDPDPAFAMICFDKNGESATIHVYADGYIHSGDGFAIRKNR